MGHPLSGGSAFLQPPVATQQQHAFQATVDETDEQTNDIDTAICSSVRPSVRLSRSGIISKRLNMSLASDHSCCKPSTSVVSPPVLCAVNCYKRSATL